MDARLKAKLASIQKTGRGRVLVVVKHEHSYAIHEVYAAKDGKLDHVAKPLMLAGDTLHDILDLLKNCEKTIQDGCLILEADLPKHD